jgi:endonuclease/exonuclease/phosphatase family metal-dependent hydrolase
MVNGKRLNMSRKVVFVILMSLLCVGEAAAQEFKVGTYNIFTSDSRVKAINANPQVSPQRYWCNSALAVASMISFLDCDVLGVQEVCDSIWGVKGENDIKRLVAEQGKVDYDWVLYPNSKSGKIQYDVALAYKKAKFELLKSGIFYLGGVRDSAILAPNAPKGTQRPCVWAHLKHKDSAKDFYFLSVHFLVPQKGKNGNSNIEGNKYNMQRLREITMDMIPADTPSILVGDFNADHNAKHWGSIGNARWLDLFQHYLAAGT